MRSVVYLAVVLAAALGCRKKDTYPTLGLTVASPTDVVVTAPNQQKPQYFMVLNADFDRTYNQGSILTLDKDGNKINAIPTPRMGRSLTLSGNNLLALFDFQVDPQDAENEQPPRAQLYDVTDPTKPVLTSDIPIDCTPVNAVMVENYNYFAFTCIDGALWVGELTANHGMALYKVRQFSVMRRALYIDKNRQLLFAFPTDPARDGPSDAELQDCETHNPLDATPYYGDLFPGYDPNNHCAWVSNTSPMQPNDVPDIYEENKRELADTNLREWYQYVVYDFSMEARAGTDPNNTTAPPCPVGVAAPCKFPTRTITDPVVSGELRWIYFDLANYDGSPDRSPFFDDPTYKFYRTNFFAAKPDPDDADVFYLSQRGSPDKSQYANNVVRVRILSDPHATLATDGTGTYSQPAPTADVMSFERVYGFRGPEANAFVYTGDFQITTIAGQKIVLVNNFRDLVNWVKGDRYFSVAGATLDDMSWYYELPGSTTGNYQSFYNLAVLPSGRAATCSFYSNQVMLLDITPGVDIHIVNSIE